jgi:hypothetical protein
MKPPFGMPGIGGSLGCCALCGDSFLLQIITGEKIVPLEIEGVNNQLYAHKKCATKYQGKPWDELPTSSPLRKAVEKASSPKTGEEAAP